MPTTKRTPASTILFCLTNLDRVSHPRVKVYALPVPVRGLDAFPLRVIAVE